MPTVVTSAGQVTGRISGGVHSWRGIPYASAERFGPAGAVVPWTGEFDASRPGPVGVQDLPDGTVTGTEACLTLDVYAPAEAPGRLPVLFWVHGGAFLGGAAADYDGSFLAALGPAVVVAVSYRLGVFGFLQLGTADDPEPSPAMTDLLAALDWAAREIDRFGGDPGRITLVGQSAGASLVCAMLAASSRVPVRAAIGLSVGGAPLEPAEALDVTDRVVAELGIACTDRQALRSAPTQAVMDAARRVSRASGKVGGAVFGPVVDGAVLPAQPADVVAAGGLRDVSLWFGSCRDEMSMFLQNGAEGPAAAARARVGDAVFDRMLNAYTSTARAGEDPLQALLTDEMWVRPIWALAEAQAAAGGRVWLSRFDHAPSLPPFDTLGPSHGADNACLWARPPRFVGRPLLQRPGGVMTASDLAVTEALQASVLSMLRAGTPAAGELADWPPYDSSNRSSALFDVVSRVQDDPSRERRLAWDRLSTPMPAGSSRAS